MPASFIPSQSLHPFRLSSYFFVWSFSLVLLTLLTACEPEDLKQLPPNSLRVYSASGAEIVDEQSVIDFGSLTKGKTYQKSFRLVNTADADLFISRVTSDNGEFTVELANDSLTLKPQQSLAFSVTYSPKSGGVSFGKISFKTNDIASPVFSFEVKAIGIVAPQIVGNGSIISGDINTVEFPREKNKGTRFEVELYIEDVSSQLDVDNFKLNLAAIFANQEVKKTQKDAADIEVSSDKKRMKFNVSVLFGESSFVDVEGQILLPSGEKSNPYTVRIERPEGAN